MKKTTAAFAALGAMSGMAQAQSNVTLYGVLDMPIEFVANQAAGAPTINPTTGAVTRQTGGNRV
ncbi:porin, partial [Klebsiella quasipneumoniae]|uniref:porin n=1 Tax=Klebsiella quasipneumoniae TaxID=1463165 RepID=UPI0020348CD8